MVLFTALCVFNCYFLICHSSCANALSNLRFLKKWPYLIYEPNRYLSTPKVGPFQSAVHSTKSLLWLLVVYLHCIFYQYCWIIPNFSAVLCIFWLDYLLLSDVYPWLIVETLDIYGSPYNSVYWWLTCESVTSAKMWSVLLFPLFCGYIFTKIPKQLLIMIQTILLCWSVNSSVVSKLHDRYLFSRLASLLLICK
jgi:hypothetical protein